MKFNILKCEAMSVSNKRNKIIENYKLYGKDIKRKEKVKYLGVIIDNKLRFKEHIEEKSKKAQTVLNMIRRNLYFAPKSVKSKAYISTVRPIMEFGSICWDPAQDNLKTKLEKVQNSAARFVTNQYSKKRQ